MSFARKKRPAGWRAWIGFELALGLGEGRHHDRMRSATGLSSSHQSQACEEVPRADAPPQVAVIERKMSARIDMAFKMETLTAASIAFSILSYLADSWHPFRPQLR
jgi:hypothetical protein